MERKKPNGCKDEDRVCSLQENNSFALFSLIVSLFERNYGTRVVLLTPLAWTARNQMNAQHGCKDEKDWFSSLQENNSFALFSLIVSLSEWNCGSFE